MGKKIQLHNVEVETTAYVDVEVDVDDLDGELRSHIEDHYGVWDELERQARCFGVDELKRYIEDNLFSRYGFRYKL